MLTDGLMGKDELRAKLAVLAETREAAESELRSIDGRRARLLDLERDKKVLLEGYAGAMPGSLGASPPKSATPSTAG